MTTSRFFNNYTENYEQLLVEDLVVESISIHGIDVYYLPRTLGNFDPLYQEDASSSYNEAYITDMYVKNPSTGFGGKGDFLGFGGYEIRDTLTLVVARRTWKNEVGQYVTFDRPREGDLVYFPFNRKVFKIMFVEHESIFYQVGALQVWELRAELFEYSGEVFDTGIPEIDILSDSQYNNNIVDDGIRLEDDTGSILDELNSLPIVPEDYVNEAEEALNALNDFYEEKGDEIIDFSCKDPMVAWPDGTY